MRILWRTAVILATLPLWAPVVVVVIGWSMIAEKPLDIRYQRDR
jgi:hypothetical protein